MIATQQDLAFCRFYLTFTVKDGAIVLLRKTRKQPTLTKTEHANENEKPPRRAGSLVQRNHRLRSS